MVTTEHGAWRDSAGRNEAQKSSDWIMSPFLAPSLGVALAAKRDTLGPTQHKLALGGRNCDGSWKTQGKGAYPDELIETVAEHVGNWWAARGGGQVAQCCVSRTRRRESPRPMAS